MCRIRCRWNRTWWSSSTRADDFPGMKRRPPGSPWHPVPIKRRRPVGTALSLSAAWRVPRKDTRLRRRVRITAPFGAGTANPVMMGAGPSSSNLPIFTQRDVDGGPLPAMMRRDARSIPEAALKLARRPSREDANRTDAPRDTGAAAYRRNRPVTAPPIPRCSAACSCVYPVSGDFLRSRLSPT